MICSFFVTEFTWWSRAIHALWFRTSVSSGDDIHQMHHGMSRELIICIQTSNIFQGEKLLQSCIYFLYFMGRVDKRVIVGEQVMPNLAVW